MSTRSAALDPKLSDWVHALSTRREHPLLAELREETSRLPRAEMQISVEQGLLLRMLARTVRAELSLEVGVFTGYSSLCVALELPSHGRLVACDVSEEWTAVARRYWDRAGVSGRIELVLAPAAETLARLAESPRAARFDLAFLDADKESQLDYYERCLVLLRHGGLVAVDNAFMGGDVVDAPDGAAARVRELAEHVFADSRVDPAMIPIGDGLLVARKR